MVASLGGAEPIEWDRSVISADSVFEAAGVADFNNDGALDIMCGDTWYAAPEWTPNRVREIAEAGGYRVDFANTPMDVDGDGWVDVVSCNWHERSVVWRRNPGKAGGDWAEHLVDRPGNMETAIAADVDDDGQADFLPDVNSKTVWYRIESGELVAYEISGEIGGHGIGFGDVNGDGRSDILKPGGWFEAPENRRGEEWAWHPEWDLGGASIQIIAHDFTGNGTADIFWGMGHDYGRNWLRGAALGTKNEPWTRAEVDRDWSQAHAVELADFDSDGEAEILTGKRYYAHNGNDPGGEDPMGIYLYRFNRAEGRFDRETISEGRPDGLGLAPVVIDIDADGDLDFVAPGKSGLYLYLQK